MQKSYVPVSSYSVLSIYCYMNKIRRDRETNLDRLVFLVQKTIMSFKMASVFCFIIPLNSSVNMFVNRRYE